MNGLNSIKLFDLSCNGDSSTHSYDVTIWDSVIKGFSFSMEKGESVGILGQCGSGKSTLTSIDL
jgi:ABC-type dipeptide/oligopeptide/nickel transport system ATPase subunit